VITTIRNLSLTGQQVRQADGEPYLADAGRIEHDVLQRPAVARLRRGKSGCDRVLRGARQGGERVAQLEPADEGRACHQQHKRNKKTADPPQDRSRLGGSAPALSRGRPAIAEPAVGREIQIGGEP
jgi:hypothetical protein